MSITMSELEGLVAENPGAPEFVELARTLSEQNQNERAICVCLAGLSHDPSNLHGRLLLARIFFEQQYIPFAAREVHELLQAHPDSEALQRLAARLDPAYGATGVGAATTSEEQVVAEADFEFDILDELDDE